MDVGGAFRWAAPGDVALVDADHGFLVINPSKADVASARAERKKQETREPGALSLPAADEDAPPEDVPPDPPARLHRPSTRPPASVRASEPPARALRTSTRPSRRPVSEE